MALSIEMQSGDVILIAADEILLPQYQPGSDCSRYPILNVPFPDTRRNVRYCARFGDLR